eukprot:1161010-Pelagomonas_calceolata.AAC.4
MRIKALLLDQAFAAGVGNWVADEVLYQVRDGVAAWEGMTLRSACKEGDAKQQPGSLQHYWQHFCGHGQCALHSPARIHPEQPVADMEAAQIKAMHTKMLEIGQRTSRSERYCCSHFAVIGAQAPYIGEVHSLVRIQESSKRNN